MCWLLGGGGRRKLGVHGRPVCVCVLCAENTYDIVGACSKDGHKFSKDNYEPVRKRVRCLLCSGTTKNHIVPHT